jgi:hypothetical protein
MWDEGSKVRVVLEMKGVWLLTFWRGSLWRLAGIRGDRRRGISGGDSWGWS